MRGSYTVALVGFSQQEALTLESFLSLPARQSPGYRVQDEVMDAQILIVNADNPQALHLVRHAELPGHVLLIGNTDGGTGWPLQRKPVKLSAVFAELDLIMGTERTPEAAVGKSGAVDSHRPSSRAPSQSSSESGFPSTDLYPLATRPSTAPSPGQRRRSRDSEFQLTLPMSQFDLLPPALAPTAAPAQHKPVPVPARFVSPNSAQRPGVVRMTELGGLDELPFLSARAVPSRRSSDSLIPPGQQSAPEASEPPRGEVLLVAESLVEGRTLLKRFKKYDLSVDWSRESGQAMVMLKAHAYRLVVIDRLSGQPDAFQVCRAAKQAKRGGRAPVVFMLAAIAGSMDRMKAGLAGCDAYLPRSVSEADLYKLLAQHRMVNLDAFARTNIGF